MIEFAVQKRLEAASGTMQLNLDVQWASGQLLTLYGNSGAGKTSVLRMLAGLMEPDQGRIVVNGELWLDTQKKWKLAPQKRKIGFVFQDYALFPNMTVKENLQFALRPQQSNQIIGTLIDLMELGHLAKQKPLQLSGGQKQRVALARTLVQQPQLLLLDEPLSALDQAMREKLQNYLTEVRRQYQLTIIWVSHDPAEILKVSDHVVHLHQGQIKVQGPPAQILQTKQLELLGEVISIEGLVVQLQVGSQTIALPFSPEQRAGLTIGDRIQLSAQLLQTQIKRL